MGVETCMSRRYFLSFVNSRHCFGRMLRHKSNCFATLVFPQEETCNLIQSISKCVLSHRLVTWCLQILNHTFMRFKKLHFLGHNQGIFTGLHGAVWGLNACNPTQKDGSYTDRTNCIISSHQCGGDNIVYHISSHLLCRCTLVISFLRQFSTKPKEAAIKHLSHLNTIQHSNDF